MATGWIEQVTGSLEQKKRYRQYKARTKQLPANYRTAIEALDRYLMYFGSITRGDTLVSMLEDLADPRDRRGGPGGVRGDVSAELLGGSVDQQGTGTVDQSH